jgi:hypothetical protein
MCASVAILVASSSVITGSCASTAATANTVIKTIRGGILSTVDPVTHVLWVTTSAPRTQQCAIQPTTYIEPCLPQLPRGAGADEGESLTTTVSL